MNANILIIFIVLIIAVAIIYSIVLVCTQNVTQKSSKELTKYESFPYATINSSKSEKSSVAKYDEIGCECFACPKECTCLCHCIDGKNNEYIVKL